MIYAKPLRAIFELVYSRIFLLLYIQLFFMLDSRFLFYGFKAWFLNSFVSIFRTFFYTFSFFHLGFKTSFYGLVARKFWIFSLPNSTFFSIYSVFFYVGFKISFLYTDYKQGNYELWILNYFISKFVISFLMLDWRLLFLWIWSKKIVNSEFFHSNSYIFYIFRSFPSWIQDFFFYWFWVRKSWILNSFIPKFRFFPLSIPLFSMLNSRHFYGSE